MDEYMYLMIRQFKIPTNSGPAFADFRMGGNLLLFDQDVDTIPRERRLASKEGTEKQKQEEE